MPDSDLILLINPPVLDFKAYDFWLKPLGLLCLGGALKKRGYRVKLFDFLDRNHPAIREFCGKNRKAAGTGKFYAQELPEKPEIFQKIPRKFKHYGLPFSVFQAELKALPAPPPRLILLTTLTTHWYLGAVELIKLLRELFPETPIALGGIYARLCYRHAGEYSGADLVVKEGSFPEIIRQLASFLGEPAFKPSQAEAFILPDFSFYPELSYACLLLSLGCPFNCPYCATPLLQPELKWAEPKEVAEQVFGLYREKGVREFAFFDDALLYQAKEHLLVFLEKILSKGLKLNFHTPNALHPAYLTPEVAQYLKRANFVTLRLGFESGDAQMQKKMGGKVDSEQLKAAVSYLKEAGFSGQQIGVYLMAGYPGSLLSQLKNSIELVHQLGVKSYLAQFSPIPGTPLGDKFLKENLGSPPFDPLYSNNTYWWYRSKEFPLAGLESLRQLSLKLNAGL